MSFLSSKSSTVNKSAELRASLKTCESHNKFDFKQFSKSHAFIPHNVHLRQDLTAECNVLF